MHFTLQFKCWQFLRSRCQDWHNNSFPLCTSLQRETGQRVKRHGGLFFGWSRANTTQPPLLEWRPTVRQTNAGQWCTADCINQTDSIWVKFSLMIDGVAWHGVSTVCWLNPPLLLWGRGEPGLNHCTGGSRVHCFGNPISGQLLFICHRDRNFLVF